MIWVIGRLEPRDVPSRSPGPALPSFLSIVACNASVEELEKPNSCELCLLQLQHPDFRFDSRSVNDKSVAIIGKIDFEGTFDLKN